jgi:aspartyl-tRNA(Asn)/glutamyl-tRNA(Gln) amidotransferase subunit A
VARHKGWEDHVHPNSLALAKRGGEVKVQEYIDALDDAGSFRLEMGEFFQDFDVLIAPTSPALPWPIGTPYPTTIDEKDVGPRGAAIFASFVNVAGLPAVSVPVSPTPAGLPIGMQLIAKFGDDVRLMALAAKYEEAQPWEARWPSVRK